MRGHWDEISQSFLHALNETVGLSQLLDFLEHFSSFVRFLTIPGADDSVTVLNTHFFFLPTSSCTPVGLTMWGGFTSGSS
jgi:hypothetical protein